MSRERWNYIKALTAPSPRWVIVSGWPKYEGTYNVGRNAEKRARRATAK